MIILLARWRGEGGFKAQVTQVDQAHGRRLSPGPGPEARPDQDPGPGTRPGPDPGPIPGRGQGPGPGPSPSPGPDQDQGTGPGPGIGPGPDSGPNTGPGQGTCPRPSPGPDREQGIGPGSGPGPGQGPRRTSTSAAELFFHSHIRSCAVSAAGAQKGHGGSPGNLEVPGFFGVPVVASWLLEGTFGVVSRVGLGGVFGLSLLVHPAIAIPASCPLLLHVLSGGAVPLVEVRRGFWAARCRNGSPCPCSGRGLASGSWRDGRGCLGSGAAHVAGTLSAHELLGGQRRPTGW